MEEGGVKPALGLAWAEGVTMRLMLTRNEAVDSEESDMVRICERSILIL